MMMQDLNNTLQQNKSGTCPAHQPNDSTQAGNQSEVECNKEDTAKSHSDSIELQPLIPDKDYPAGVREWMMTAPSELKFSTLAVASSMLAVYATRIRLNYVYDNSLSAILLHVLVCGDQSSGKSFARYLMRYLMDPFIKRDTEQRIHLAYLSLATLGYSTDIGYIDSVPMVVLAVVFVLAGIGFLVSEKFKKH